MPQRTQGDRIGALEEGYRNLGRSIDGLREDFHTFARDVRAELGHRSRTQWSPILAAVSLVVAVLGGLITLGAQGPLREIDRHANEIDAIRSDAARVAATRFTNDDGRRVWEAIADLRDEDFDRHEAERMLADLLGRIDLRDEAVRRELGLAVAALRDRIHRLEAVQDAAKPER